MSKSKMGMGRQRDIIEKGNYEEIILSGGSVIRSQEVSDEIKRMEMAKLLKTFVQNEVKLVTETPKITDEVIVEKEEVDKVEISNLPETPKVKLYDKFNRQQYNTVLSKLKEDMNEIIDRKMNTMQNNTYRGLRCEARLDFEYTQHNFELIESKIDVIVNELVKIANIEDAKRPNCNTVSDSKLEDCLRRMQGRLYDGLRKESMLDLEAQYKKYNVMEEKLDKLIEMLEVK